MEVPVNRFSIRSSSSSTQDDLYLNYTTNLNVSSNRKGGKKIQHFFSCFTPVGEGSRGVRFKVWGGLL